MSEALSEEPQDLRGALDAAFAADEANPAPVEQEAAPVSDGPARSPDGKFALKTEGVQAAATIPTTPAPQDQEAPQESIRPPASWSAQAKADFATLAPHIQAEVLRRETEVNKGFEERAAKLKPWEAVDQALAPVRSRLAMNGLNDASYVQALVAADESLRGPNKVQALIQLAQQYGIDPRQFAQPDQYGQQPQQAQLPPQYQDLAQRFEALQQSVMQQQTAAEQTATAQTQAQIDAFAKDHLYFENVKPTMAALLKSGQASDLDSAYAKACRLDDTIFPLVQKEEADRKTQADKAAATARVSDARRAAGSLTGSPAPGTVPTRTGPAPSLRDALAEAWDA